MADNFKCSADFNPKLKREVEIIDIFLLLILVSLCIISLLSYGFYRTEITHYVILYGVLGLFVSIVFIDFFPQFVVLDPYLFLTVSITSGVNIILAVIIASLASILGSTLAFELGRSAGYRMICPLFDMKKIIRVIKFWKKYGKWFVLASVYTPLPYFPLVFGALEMKRRDFWLFGLLPRVIALALIGYAFYLLGFKL